MDDGVGVVEGLAVQLLPEQVLQLGDALPRDGRDEATGQIVGQVGRQCLGQLLVEEVAFGDGQYATLAHQLRVVALQLAQQDLVLLTDVVRIGRHHEEQQSVAFNVAEEAQPESTTVAGALDNPRDVGHDERAIVAPADDAQVRLQRGEGIVGDLRLGG